MVKIMFVCHGNICRSPMAEFIMKDMIKKEYPDEEIYVCSSATSTEEIGNPVYPPAKNMLRRHGIDCTGKHAVQLKRADYDNYDLFIIMDSNNYRNINRIFQSDPQNKIHKLLEFADRTDDVADPWYTGDFEKAYADIYEGCTGLIEYIRKYFT